MNIEKKTPHSSSAERRLYGNSGIIVLEDLKVVGSVYRRYGGEVGREVERLRITIPLDVEGEEVASRRASHDTSQSKYSDPVSCC